MYKLFLTWRYLSRRPLSLVAVAMLSLSIWALVMVPSIMSGFQTEFHKRIRGTLADLTLFSGRPFGIQEDPLLERRLYQFEHVTGVAPYLENPALDSHLSKIDYCFVRGIDPWKEEKVNNFGADLLSERELAMEMAQQYRGDERALQEQIAQEATDAVDKERIYRMLEEGDPEQPGLPTCVVGIYYMLYWDVMVGDTISLTTATEDGEVSQDQQFVVVGAFQTGFSEKDRRGIITSLESLQEFVGAGGRLSGYGIKLTDYKLADTVKLKLQEAYFSRDLPGITRGVAFKTWEEHNQTLLRAVRMEKLLIRLIIFIIVVAASSSIFLVLFMSVHTKVRELGILRAVGATPKGVLLLFVGQGLLIAVAGMAVGLALGVTTSHYLNEIADAIHAATGWHPFPPEVYYLDRIPSKIEWGENAFNFTITLVIGSVAAVVPGMLAALRPPLKAIRYE